MKTIKEKAKDYDETLERALYGKYCINNVLEYLFPELAESKEEDERIRKTIIGFLKNIEEENESYLIFDNTTTTDMIAWLEKQESEPNWCHHKVDLSNCSEEYRKAYYDGWNNCNMQHSQCKSEGNDVVKCLINGMKFYYEDNEEATWGTEKFSMKVKDILSWLEKQGQVKEYTFKSIPRLLDMIEPNDRAKAYCQKLIDTLAKEGYNTDVKIVEEVLKGWNGEDVPMAVMDEQQVPVLDFKAKDWYVSKVDGKIHNIYYSVDKPEPKFKVGDWVVNNDTKDVFLIKSFNNGYCTLEDIKGNIISPCLPQCESESHLWTIQDAKDGDVLACNEEILLFKSYSVQGRISLYCWYNGQTNNFHSKEVVDTLMTTRNKICPATKEQRDLLFAKMKEAGYEWDAEKKELKLLITNGGDFFESENCEQKPTEWSLPYGKNETAEKLIALAEILEMDGDCLFNGVSGNSYGKFLRVLAKELTEVKPAEWSKEDDVMVHDILGWLPAKSRPEYNQRRADWLKSLKGRVQPKQKWSEEDERIYKSITYSFAHNYPLTVQQQEFIKSLKDRYTWKPSDEQMEALWCATEKYLESDNANVVELRGKVLESLYNDLKKLTE